MIEILHKGTGWIVVNKPGGLSVHNLEDPESLLTKLENQKLKGFNPVNRLDKETSGIMVLSREAEITSEFQKILSSRDTLKSYRAIVRGGFLENAKEGVWIQALSDKSEGRKNPQGVKENRKRCETHYEVLTHNDYVSYMKFDIKTGRQHQIRKHCALNGHHIIGDARYGDLKHNKMIKSRYGFEGMALHAYHLMFEFRGEKWR